MRIAHALLPLAFAFAALSTVACGDVFDPKPPLRVEPAPAPGVAIDSGRGTAKSDKHQVEVSIGGPHPVGKAENDKYKLELAAPVGD